LSIASATRPTYTLSLHDALPIARADADGQAALGDRLAERARDRAAGPRDQDAGEGGGQDGARRHPGRGLLEHAGQVDDLRAGAPVLLGDRDAEQPEFGEPGPQRLPRVGIGLLGAYDAHGLGGLRPGLDRVLNLGLIRGGGDAHNGSSTRRGWRYRRTRRSDPAPF